MKYICVYCGSSPGRSPEYIEYAIALAKELVTRDIGLVYGGASVGIMGEIANTVLDGGGEVIGVIPQSLVDKEISHKGLTELKVVSTMHERKAIMAEISDGFIALPGGLGTIEELFEVLTWSQLGFHKKPCALLNIKQYYDSLSLFLDHAVEQQFIKPVHREMLLVEDDPARLLHAMEEYIPPAVDKWIGRDEI
ncbi:MAG: TIGR00730 family Rossman fold protein [Gammaproteobacteria bacterium]|nr:TIGR00730 family Rossman fold protein [Gammaproteobacteria bacterium]